MLTESGNPHAEVSVLLADDAEIHRLNRLWRNIDRPTDVLSWPQETLEPPLTGTAGAAAPLDALLLGDVAISLDTAQRQANARGWTLDEEVALLLVHGILHLLGHEDDSDEGAEAMRSIETRLLGKPLDKTDAVPG